MTNILEWHGYW